MLGKEIPLGMKENYGSGILCYCAQFWKSLYSMCMWMCTVAISFQQLVTKMPESLRNVGNI